MNYKFKQLHSIRDIYDYIVKLIEENYYKITPDITNLKLTLLIRGNFNQNQEVQIYLTCFERKYGNAKNQQEYINILANEIKRLRSTSKIIDELKDENGHLKTEISELKGIISNRKSVTSEAREDIFDDKITIDEFNKKFKLNLTDNNLKKLDLNNKKLGEDVLEYLTKLDLKDLQKLYLGNNDLSNIQQLANTKFPKLQKLSLVENKISDINILEKVRYDDLRELYLYNNSISSIRILEDVKFKHLQVLSLGYNKISNINVLSNVHFNDLKELFLYNNNISNINVFSKCKFEKLEKLALNNNAIVDISVFDK